MNIQEDIDDIMEENGPFGTGGPVADDVIGQYLGKLPKLLTTFWKQQGLGFWKGGLFTLCHPASFDGLLSQIFHADSDFSHADCYIYGYSSFGHLLVWSERHWVVQIDLLNGRIACPVLIDPSKAINPDIHMSTSLSIHVDSLDVYDDDNKKLFSRAVKKLGRPEPGHVLGFTPALAMGGAPKLENLKIVPALEHFLFLAQLQQFQLIDYLAQPPRVVRAVG